jgi:hypothetical protein
MKRTPQTDRMDGTPQHKAPNACTASRGRVFQTRRHNEYVDAGFGAMRTMITAPNGLFISQIDSSFHKTDTSFLEKDLSFHKMDSS